MPGLKKAGSRGGAQLPPRGGWGGRSPPHLQMVVIHVRILIYTAEAPRAAGWLWLRFTALDLGL